MDEFEQTLNRLRKYFDELEEFKGSKLENKKDFYAASMILFTIINESILLTEFFMAKKTLPAPLSYKEMIDTLREKKVIDEKLASKMKVIIQKRNLIAHEYGEIDRKDIIELIKEIDVVKEFIGLLLKRYY